MIQRDWTMAVSLELGFSFEKKNKPLGERIG